LRIAGFFACWSVLMLGACANQPGAIEGLNNRADLITDSDETDLRRRARLRVELATGYFEQGQTKVALDEIKQSLATDPTFVDAYNLRGLVYMRLNDIALAEDSFRRALALNSRDSGVAHNYAWMLCQQGRYPESFKLFAQAAANPTYTGKAKTLMTLGVCQVKAGQLSEAEQSLMHSYELDAGNPVTGYNLSSLLYARGDLTRAQFYIRRLNNTDLANAQTLWLGIKTEKKLNNAEAMVQLGNQLKKRFAFSPEAAAYEKGLFNE
jgi:type IV pilus assembly protein PilF